MNQLPPTPLLQQVAAMSIAIGMSFFCVGIVDAFISKPLWLVVFLWVVGAVFMTIGAVILRYHKKKQ